MKDFTNDFFRAFNEGYGSIVLYREIEGDLDTPISILSRLLDYDNVFLLESAKEDKTYSRFSFIGFGPKRVIEINKLNDIEFDRLSVFKTAELGSFCGGYVGYFSFEAIELFDILRKPLKKKPTKYGLFFEIEDFLVYDNYTNRLYLGLHYRFDDSKTAYSNLESAQDRLEGFYVKIKKMKDNYMPSKSKPEFLRRMFSTERFIDNVNYIKGLIEKGEVIQVVLSNFFEVGGLEPFEFYRNLRRINPSPYMFFFKNNVFCIAGSSPEIHLRVRKDVATLRPIAGTKPRGGNLEKIKRQLLDDEKEKAEHIMLVDLARNDLSRISKPGAVTVTSFMRPEVYSHVIHLTSNVQADIKEGVSVVDVIANTFPAGTLSGAPKVRAIEIIDEIETYPRGAYGGCLGYIGFDGDLDLAITIRTAIFNNNIAKLQAGAGIVYDSKPQSEYSETINKLRALLKAGGIDDSFDR